MVEGPEQIEQLMAFAKAEFGEHLTALLLSGYDGSPRGQVCAYDVSLRESEGGESVARVKVVSDAPSSLPARGEPLVLLALLKLIRPDDAPRTELAFTHESILGMLRQEDSKETRRLIGRAVERYYFLSLEKEVPEDTKGGAGRFHRVLAQRIIIHYSYYSEGDETDEERERLDSRVIFNPTFIQGLRDRTLLGIDWSRALTLTRRD